ncbi:hypothetical protein C0991_010313 [Blastosporella zonata]|nr:hypothetical protein C0991_010313 [Blastosporella zonata]
MAATNTFGWDESYEIGATTQKFKQGEVVGQSGTDVFPIKFQEAATIGRSFNDFSIGRDPEGPTNGFRFIIDQDGPSASAIIYMKDAGADNNVPVFISPKAYPDESETTLIPTKKVKVFFEQKLVTGTMTTSSETHPVDLDFSTEQGQTWFLNNQGKWKQL